MASYDFSAPRLFVQPDLRPGAVLALEADQRNYLRNVLRLKEGGDVLVFNGRDGEWRARFTQGEGSRGEGGRGDGKGAGRGPGKGATLVAEAPVRAQTAPGDLHYLFAPLKHARLDYMVQKAVEMGAGALRPVLTRRTQASRVNGGRVRANAIEAAEQCGILSIPAVHDPEPLARVLAGWDAGRTLVFCDEDAERGDPAAVLRALARDAPAAVLIGPEGGFDEGERAALLAVPGVVRLSLGPRVLRADTAAVAALALVQAVAGDWR